MNDTPLPLIVSATMTLGRPFLCQALADRRVDLFEAVAVDLVRIPAERPELGCDGFARS